jgi:hypothetical protein
MSDAGIVIRALRLARWRTDDEHIKRVQKIAPLCCEEREHLLSEHLQLVKSGVVCDIECECLGHL